MGAHPEFDPRVLGWVNGCACRRARGCTAPQEFVALRHVLDDMRLYKSRAEQAS
jgi:Xaa-Pro aminopeptidase